MIEEKRVPYYGEKLDRNRKIVEFAESHPGMTLEAIGRVFGGKKALSRQRIQAILRNYGSQSHCDPRKVNA